MRWPRSSSHRGSVRAGMVSRSCASRFVVLAWLMVHLLGCMVRCLRQLCSVNGGGGSWNLMESLHHVIDHRLRDSGIEADPENVVHYKVSVPQIANHAPLNVAIGGLAKQVAAEEQAGGYFSRLKEAHDLAAGCGRILSDSEWKAKPAWVRMRGGLGQDENVVEVAERGGKFGVVGAPGGNKARQLLELCDSDCGLHVGRLEVVADVAVNIFVIVSAGQIAKFPFKAAPAG